MKKNKLVTLLIIGIIVVLVILTLIFIGEEKVDYEQMTIEKMIPETIGKWTVSKSNDIKELQALLTEGRKVIPHPKKLDVTVNEDGTGNFPTTKSGIEIRIFERRNMQDVKYSVSINKIHIEYYEDEAFIADIWYEFDAESYQKINDLIDTLDIE